MKFENLKTCCDQRCFHAAHRTAVTTWNSNYGETYARRYPNIWK